MNTEAKRLFRPHVDSFNRFLHESIGKITRSFEPIEVLDLKGNKVRIALEKIMISKPMLYSRVNNNVTELDRILPSECRRSSRTYKSSVTGTLNISVNGIDRVECINLGLMPIMVHSDKCHLKGMSEGQLVQAKEDPNDFGGYFIQNGTEKLCRLIQIQKRNYLIGMYRESMKKQITGMSPHLVSVKSTAPDGTASAFSLHYMHDHSIKVKIVIQDKTLYIPLAIVLRALSGNTDKEIKDSLCSVLRDNSLLEYVDLLLQSFMYQKEYGQHESLVLLGNKMHPFYRLSPWSLTYRLPAGMANKVRKSLHDDPACYDAQISQCYKPLTDLECGKKFLQDKIAVHTEDFEEKYNLIILAIAKLIRQVAEVSAPDNVDSLPTHELISVGDTFAEIMAHNIKRWRRSLLIHTVRNAAMCNEDFTESSVIDNVLKCSRMSVEQHYDNLIATGTVKLSTIISDYFGSQKTGLTIIAERLNFWRYFSHFRSVHRGAIFEELRTSAVRQLLPESWGFLCPVHTPDGTPCGLLTHLSHQCEVSQQSHNIPLRILTEMGVSVAQGNNLLGIPVIQNLVVVGTVKESQAERLVHRLRALKIKDKKYIHAEVFYQNTPLSQPAIYIINTPNRLVRPVYNLLEKQIEYIGTTEQLYIQIQNLGDSSTPNATHKEIDPTSILSIVAGSTPLGNFNPSPRNMYQCQMGKQSMGTTPHSQKYRSDQKVYSLDYPQVPLLHTNIYKKYNLGEYANGQNITIAILSYTGYDIEDAVILNKASVDRGFLRGTVIKADKISPTPKQGLRLGNALETSDGLPSPGQAIDGQECIYTMTDINTLQEVEIKNKSHEPLKITDVLLYEQETGERAAMIKSRTTRIPTIGDKFSSRHGQKGVCSILYEDEDMPFSVSGVTPDLIINPHAFPSRMSIGMFIENIATKAGALDGEYADGTMFKYNEQQKAHEYFGDKLEAHGFKRGGGETLYSGVSGKPLKAEVFFGIVYYQRLRHMVGDKFQVRSVGPINNFTRQPVGGRKRGGGIRLGEMERDALISHGAVATIQDRMVDCSDGTVLNVCKACNAQSFYQHWKCSKCNTSRNLVRITMPYVFKYLVSELASMNVNCKLVPKKIELPTK
ncbi:DNA-directed RNA polymerase I subunit RPA2 [Nematocida sp. AWRm80]|nr:DNA-directed RNA polymerase I subunit RPA2 [Nematocida sp. AWRm80]